MIKRKIKIPRNLLPKDYRQIGATKFDKSEVLISKVVNGHSRNDEIFNFFLEMAEIKKAELTQRVTALEN